MDEIFSDRKEALEVIAQQVRSLSSSVFIKNDVRFGGLLTSAKCCIHRVPKKLVQSRVKACTLQVVSIGPYHHGEKSLRAMEEQKLRYLENFLKRTNLGLDVCVQALKKGEARGRFGFGPKREVRTQIWSKF
ncbi:Protein of unknown function DUF247, plant [Dillenia turbinata]|uniref:Uncharacterized protein n=1 Tax=Dillenia turbinata TaxID=194707 RepID=A0AAN8V4P4_9MAGN